MNLSRRRASSESRRDSTKALARMNCRCGVCGASDSYRFLEIEKLPALIGVQWSSKDEARGCRSGPIRLVYCRSCGFIWNDLFDPKIVEYGESYDNSLEHSPVFRRFARGLAERLISTYDIRHKQVVELGCGKGYFLKLLCAMGENSGLGIDPSRGHERHSSAPVRYRNRAFAGTDDFRDAGLVCCRHVFEHIPHPLDFLKNVRRSLGERSEAVVYFEVPNVRFILDGLSVWDVIYEHCGYFSSESLRRVFELAGFEVLELKEAFDGQFLGIEARPAGKSACPGSVLRDLSGLDRSVRRFGRRMRRCKRVWQTECARFRESGRRMVLWGGGAKAVSFLNLLHAGEEIPAVVDINPSKQGKYMPGTGQPIVAPEYLSEIHPDTVLLMNPAYRSEVAKQIRDLGLTVDVMIASGQRLDHHASPRASPS